MQIEMRYTRRLFVQRLARLLMIGGLEHFALFDKQLIADQMTTTTSSECPGGGHLVDNCQPGMRRSSDETDYCPGGAPTEDICVPDEGFEDYCPGGGHAEDECPQPGSRQEDICDTGYSVHDVCLPGGRSSVEQSPDQCPSGMSSDDVCPEGEVKDTSADKCYSGISPNPDVCPSSGWVRDGDECPGGGNARDNCENDVGDQCSSEGQENQAADSCRGDMNEPIGLRVDNCGYDFALGTSAADVCYEGTNTQISMFGGDDICKGLEIAGHKPYGDGSDTCLDGSEAQDDCGGINGSDGNKEVDVCLPNQDGEMDDLCNPSQNDGSDDVCYQGLHNTDDCAEDPKDPDECPGGTSNADVCISGLATEDECPIGRDDYDVCYVWVSGSDECTVEQYVNGEDTPSPECVNIYQDHVE